MARNLHGQGRRPHEWRGRWRAYLTVGYDADGRPDRRYVYGDTAGECQAKLDALKQQHSEGSLRRRDSACASARGSSGWLDGKGGEVAGRTIDIYRSELKRVPAQLRRRTKDRPPQAATRATDGGKPCRGGSVREGQTRPVPYW